ncbi:hypothetical protein [Pedobacter sp. B4-66]|uniref:hypothetical protein n=1 Tax=Pedobacter sp. B4-66 TaxID=2817280 RepID=UPI001BDB5F39|nr:hypothetical protein [Pedobacter sp. B4-66]
MHWYLGKENVLTQILKAKGMELIPDSKEKGRIILAHNSYAKTIPGLVQEFFEYLFEKQFLEAFVCDLATGIRELSSKVFCELSRTFLPEDFLLKNN